MLHRTKGRARLHPTKQRYPNRAPALALVLLRRLHLPTPLHRDSPAPATTAAPFKHTLAVLGGGLSGLSAAHYFLRTLDPSVRRQTRAVVLEKEERVGGWCRAVRLQDGRKLEENERPLGDEDLLVFETGPRSIRPVGLLGWLTIEMAHDIGLTRSLVVVPKTVPSARNRYLYTPPSLTLLPSSLTSALTSVFTTPLIRRILPSLLLEPFRPRSALHALPDGGDESVDAFFARRFGRVLADEMLSAMIHGIYAGDARRLSVRAVFPQLWEAEREWGSVVLAGLFGGLARRRGWKERSVWRARQEGEEGEMRAIKARLRASGDEGEQLVGRMEKASVWGVKGGLQGLTETLRDRLRDEGIEFWMGEKGRIEQVVKVRNGWRIRTSAGDLDATHLVTTIPQLLPSSLAPPSLPATTVSVVNLSFPAPPPDAPPLFPPGFGYLIPRTVPASHNPHSALGVIFDSDVQPDVDSSRTAGLVKVSLLLGGSYWLDRHPLPSPSHDKLVAAARETLALHFPATEFPAPTHAFTSTHRECIPQVPPGSGPAFQAFGERLKRAGNVAVVGGGFGAVGVNGCVKAAWEVGRSFAEALNEGRDDEAGEKAARVVRTGTELWEL
ncbi:oxygen-dependent protoporphyrinogen oxidase [Rhodotorula kratochvilovae]